MFATLAHLSTPYYKSRAPEKLLYLLVRVFDIDKSTSFTEKKCLYQSTSPLLLLILKNLDRISNSIFYCILHALQKNWRRNCKCNSFLFYWLFFSSGTSSLADCVVCSRKCLFLCTVVLWNSISVPQNQSQKLSQP